MKKSERRMILLLIIIAIIIIAVLVNIRNKKNSGGNDDIINNGGDDVGQEQIVEEFVQISDNGEKVNTSEKLAETKTFSNYEVSKIRLTEKDGQSTILADVKNIGSTKSEVVLIDITLLDKEGNEIVTIGGIIGDAEPGATVQLNASATTDFANAYDFTVKISEQQ